MLFRWKFHPSPTPNLKKNNVFPINLFLLGQRKVIHKQPLTGGKGWGGGGGGGRGGGAGVVGGDNVVTNNVEQG